MTSYLDKYRENNPVESNERSESSYLSKYRNNAESSYFDDISEYGKTILKGTSEGLGRLGKLMGPTYDLPKVENGRFNPGRTKEQELEQQTQNLDELLPTEDSFTQRGLRRGLKEVPTALSFPGSTLATLPRAIAAGFMGESAKELGAPEWAQAAAELTAYIGPDLTKKLLEGGKNKKLIQFAKKKGMTDEEITPLIQSGFKQKWLSKLAPKEGSTKKALENTKTGLDKTYSIVKNSEPAAIEISERANGKLINGITEKLQEMPRGMQDLIGKDLQDLLNNKITGKSLINFWKDINHNSRRAKELSLLKKPIKEALESVSPEMAKDFEMVNNLYTKYYPISSKLKPTLASQIVSAGETLGTIGAVGAAMIGNPIYLKGMVGEKLMRKLAQQMLINPRFQQISQKTVKAMNENKYGVVKKLYDLYAHEIKEIIPSLSKEIKSLSEEEIKEMLVGQD